MSSLLGRFDAFARPSGNGGYWAIATLSDHLESTRLSFDPKMFFTNLDKLNCVRRMGGLFLAGVESFKRTRPQRSLRRVPRKSSGGLAPGNLKRWRT
jgi:hypothetical protein